MPTWNYKPEQMVTILRQMEVQMANGKTAPEAVLPRMQAGNSRPWTGLHMVPALT